MKTEDPTLGDQIISFLESFFGNARALIILIASAIPITEQRATIPLGIFWDMNPWLVGSLAFSGSLLPAPLLQLRFSNFLALLASISWLNRVTRFIDEKFQKKARQFEKSSEAALIVFIAIPLPGTGIWTGSMVASLLGFSFRKSLLCVVLGALISAVVLTLAFSLIRYGVSFF